jgi:Family of unknown function (DUF6529)
MTADPYYSPMTPAQSMTRLFVPLAIGAAVSVALGVYGHVHNPTGIAVNIAGFSSPQTVKVWLATTAATLAAVQLVSALVMYGKIPGVQGPYWLGGLHRWSGRVAFLLTVPVAVHCLYALGFATFDTRVLVHSVAGCFFFGAFTVKMLILPRAGVPGWSLPLFGGLVFTAIAALWLTSAFWFFTTIGVKL